MGVCYSEASVACMVYYHDTFVLCIRKGKGIRPYMIK